MFQETSEAKVSLTNFVVFNFLRFNRMLEEDGEFIVYLLNDNWIMIK